MLLKTFASLLYLIRLSKAVGTASPKYCTPALSSTDDDAPAINSAIKECGQGGIIQVPPPNTYQIASTVDLSPCNGCTFQIDGRLNISSDWHKWVHTRTIFQLSGSRGLSMFGYGNINGNGLDMYDQWRTIKLNATNAPLAFNITNATDISIGRLNIINPLGDVFLVSNATSISFNWVVIGVEVEKLNHTVSTGIKAFEIGASTGVSITKTAMSTVFTCVRVHNDTKQLSVNGATCNDSWDGFLIDTEQEDGWDHYVQDISFSGLTISKVKFATGFSAFQGTVHASNITWDNVQVDNVETAAMVEHCAAVGSSACYPGRGSGFDFKNITFNGFKGNAKADKYVDCLDSNAAVCATVAFTNFAVSNETSS
jgi:galacturan 1,4-alpha-galacturonidase